MDSIIQVDQEKCIRCSICASVCPTDVIKMGKHGPEDTGNP
ncbi:MAG: nitroreductase [Firmicutes bacterium]|nr:nitroreductase [Bacillota bacterium]